MKVAAGVALLLLATTANAAERNSDENRLFRVYDPPDFYAYAGVGYLDANDEHHEIGTVQLTAIVPPSWLPGSPYFPLLDVSYFDTSVEHSNPGHESQNFGEGNSAFALGARWPTRAALYILDAGKFDPFDQAEGDFVSSDYYLRGRVAWGYSGWGWEASLLYTKFRGGEGDAYTPRFGARFYDARYFDVGVDVWSTVSDGQSATTAVSATARYTLKRHGRVTLYGTLERGVSDNYDGRYAELAIEIGFGGGERTNIYSPPGNSPTAVTRPTAPARTPR